MRIDVHSHLVFLDYLKHLAGRSSLPKGVLDGGTYFVSCAGVTGTPRYWPTPT